MAIAGLSAPHLSSRVDEDEEGVDFVQALLAASRRAATAAMAVPCDDAYSVCSVTCETEISDVSARLAFQLFDVYRWLCPEVLEAEGIQHGASLAASYSTIEAGFESLYSRVNEALGACLADGPDVPVSASRKRRSKSAIPSAKRHRPMPHSGETANSQPRPQERWADLVDNWRSRYVPRIWDKPHAKVPIPREILEAQNRGGRDVEVEEGEMCWDAAFVTSDGPPLPHPYEFELSKLEWGEKGDEEVLYGGRDLMNIHPPEVYEAMEDTPLMYISTAEELRAMIAELSDGTHSMLAIDVEHHSIHSYRGFCCLIQISSRSKDFIIDPFDLFDHLSALNVITADPKILKVLHGCEADVIWLQRDFAVYLVNVFDTGQGAKALGLPGGRSLANVLRWYCDLAVDKTHQQSDWRQRPLPKSMVTYARSDTHYLLYVADVMMNQLLARPEGADFSDIPNGTEDDLCLSECGRDNLRGVLMATRDICMRVYEEKSVDFEAVASRLCERQRASLAATSFSVLQDLLKLRDSVARIRDESPHILLADHQALRIARTLPSSREELRKIFSTAPLLLRDSFDEILDVVRNHKGDARTQAAVKAVFQKLPALKTEHKAEDVTPDTLPVQWSYDRGEDDEVYGLRAIVSVDSPYHPPSRRSSDALPVGGFAPCDFERTLFINAPSRHSVCELPQPSTFGSFLDDLNKRRRHTAARARSRAMAVFTSFASVPTPEPPRPPTPPHDVRAEVLAGGRRGFAALRDESMENSSEEEEEEKEKKKEKEKDEEEKTAQEKAKGDATAKFRKPTAHMSILEAAKNERPSSSKSRKAERLEKRKQALLRSPSPVPSTSPTKKRKSNEEDAHEKPKQQAPVVELGGEEVSLLASEFSLGPVEGRRKRHRYPTSGGEEEAMTSKLPAAMVPSASLQPLPSPSTKSSHRVGSKRHKGKRK